ncbi:hypothetical protein GCM10007216_05330 [Thalassobacillus devorans]|uniref:Lipoprotein n=1 Tax=Thalassobacillus devorans TaxID=279813 RepID=A0ABQ1NHY1_9BACI|nr:hypothetical protein [Thalassobacillus devorans]NIK27440.1 hypothetical protein [Thalassobacillus devorans]GGC77711.1 hypothetical protein GCM10007216_05330 [Thalassobacillus devorans]
MKKIYFLLVAIAVMVIAAGCAKAESGDVTIQKNPDSDYEKTFDELALGELNEYTYHRPKDESLTGEIFVELYENGVKQENTTSLSFNWEEGGEQEGALGMGLIEHNQEEPSLLLYSPDGTLKSSKLQGTIWTDLSIRGWQDAVGGEELSLETGKEYILGAYTGSIGNEMSMYDLTDEEELEEMLNAHEFVLLFKIRLGENDQG